MKWKNKRSGFTLAELLIVIVIIGVLVAISIPIFNTQLEKARRAVDLDNARSIYSAIGAAVNSGDLVIGESQYITLYFFNDASKGTYGIDGVTDFNNAKTKVKYKGKDYGWDNFPGPKNPRSGVTAVFFSAILKDYGIDAKQMLSHQTKNKWYAVQVSFTGGIRGGFAEGDSYSLSGTFDTATGLKSKYFTVDFS